MVLKGFPNYDIKILCVSIYIYIYIYNRTTNKKYYFTKERFFIHIYECVCKWRGTLSMTIVIVENEIGQTSSNLGGIWHIKIFR